MPSHNKKGRSKYPPGPPFIRMNRRLLESCAWHALTFLERAAYTELLQKFKGNNNGWMFMSARELAKRMPCNKDSAARALRKLEDEGFIKCTKIGTFNRKREASEYLLTDFDDDRTGHQATQDYNPKHRFEQADRKRYQIRCANCGKNFKAQRRDAKYCSEKCRSAIRRKGCDRPHSPT